MASRGQAKPAMVTHPARERLLRLLDGMADGVSIVNRQGVIEYANAALENEFGPAKGRNLSEYFENLPSFSSQVEGDGTHEKQFCRADWRCHKNDRKYELLTIPFLGSDGQLARLQIFQDVTQRKLAERILSEKEEHYRTLVDTLAEGLVILNENEVCIYANKRYCTMLGYARGQLIGKPLEAHLDESSRIVLQGHKPLRRRGGQLRCELAFVRKDGTRLTALVSKQAIFDAAGWFKGSAALIADITEMRLGNERLHDSEDRIRNLSYHILEAQEVERRRISRDLHDGIGQALTVMKIQMEIVTKGLSNEQQGTKRDCEGVIAYIDQVIDHIRRLSSELSPSVLEDIGIRAALRRLVRDFTAVNNLQISGVIGDVDNLFAKKAEIILYRIVQEALSNITRHAKASNVTVMVEKEGDKASFLVEDDGIGFDLNTVLQDPIRKGMGLATLGERVRMLDGSLDLRSEVGKGTRIQFSIPIVDGGSRW